MVLVPEAILIALREGLEALIIVGILTALVVKLGRPDARRWIWAGAAAGTAFSVAFGGFVLLFVARLFEQAGGAQLFELVAAGSAAAILTYMVVWMYRHTRTLLGGVKERVRKALSEETLWALAGLTFVTVVREGVEIVLFYTALSATDPLADIAVSGIAGFALSAVIVALYFRGTVDLDLRRFFGVTGMMLVFIAGGMLVHTVHAAAELGIVPHGEPLWSLGGVLANDAPVGRVLHALFGYHANPTLLQAVAYGGYVLGVGGWYLHHLGVFDTDRRILDDVNPRAAAFALAVLLVASTVLAGVAGLFTAGTPIGATAPPLDERDDVEVGVLYRNHGAPPRYNESTYPSFASFFRQILVMTDNEELLQADQGTVLLDRDHPYATTPPTDPALMDAWTSPWDRPAIFVGDPARIAGETDASIDGSYWMAPGQGPGLGEPDILEIFGLATWLEHRKMGGHSPHYHQAQDVRDAAIRTLEDRYGLDLRIEQAFMIDPQIHEGQDTRSAVERLVEADVTHIVDFYSSSAHSDIMNTCMMKQNTREALDEAGWDGEIVEAGMPGVQPEWGRAVADRTQSLLDERYQDDEDVAVFLSQHGASPERDNVCGEGKDQYFGNTKAQFRRARQAIVGNVTHDGRLEVHHVFGQGGSDEDDPDERVLSPEEALETARRENFSEVLVIPYDMIGNGYDNLNVLRESFGFSREQAPYFDDDYETHFTRNGTSVLITSSHFGVETRAHAHVRVVDVAIQQILEGSP